MLQAERDRIVRRFVPLGMLVCVIWVGIQMVLNVRERAGEIGVLMAQGFRAGAVRMLILSKAALQGVAGGAAGFVLGAVAAVLWEHSGAATAPLAVAIGIRYFGFAVAMSALACLLGSWLPAWMALRTDPAVVLRRD
jgi:putative ABC transport system permease protein